MNEIDVEEPDASATSRFGKPSTTQNNKRKVHRNLGSNMVLEED